MKLIALTLALIFMAPVAVRAELQWLEFSPTGDPLFDRYALLVLERHEEMARWQETFTSEVIKYYQLPTADSDTLRAELDRVTESMSDEDWSKIEEKLKSAGLEADRNHSLLPEDVKGWESEFGNDPRYWQLVLGWKMDATAW